MSQREMTSLTPSTRHDDNTTNDELASPIRDRESDMNENPNTNTRNEGADNNRPENQAGAPRTSRRNRIEPTEAPYTTAHPIGGRTSCASWGGYLMTWVFVGYCVAIYYGCYFRQHCDESYTNYSTVTLIGAIISCIFATIFVIFSTWSYFKVSQTTPGPAPTFLRSAFFEETVKRAIVLYCRKQEFQILVALRRKLKEEEGEAADRTHNNYRAISDESYITQDLSLLEVNPEAPCIYLHDISTVSERNINWDDSFSPIYRKVVSVKYFSLAKRQQELASFDQSAPTSPQQTVTTRDLLNAAFIPRENREAENYYSTDIKNIGILQSVGAHVCQQCSEINLLSQGGNTAGGSIAPGVICYTHNGAPYRLNTHHHQPTTDPATVASPLDSASTAPLLLAGPIVKWGEIHHCRSCEQCVLALDHHCPWVGQCVGRNNHKFFIQFLGFVSMGALVMAASMARDLFTGKANISVALGLSTPEGGGKANACTFLMMVAFVLECLFFLMLFPFFITSIENAVKGDTKLERMIRDREQGKSRWQVRQLMEEGNNGAQKQHQAASGHHDAANPNVARASALEGLLMDVAAEYHSRMASGNGNIAVYGQQTTAQQPQTAVVHIENNSSSAPSFLTSHDPDDHPGTWQYNLSTIFGPSRLQRFYGKLAWLIPVDAILDMEREYLLWRSSISHNVVNRFVGGKR